MFFFFVGPFIPALYTGAHLLAARKVPFFLRVSGVLLLLAISQIYPINITLFKNLSGPDMPAWLLKAQTALFAALVMLFLFLLARDVLSLAAFLGRVFFRKKAAAFCGVATIDTRPEEIFCGEDLPRPSPWAPLP